MPRTVNQKNSYTDDTELKTRKRLRGKVQRHAKCIHLSEAEMRVALAYCKATGNQYWTVALRNVAITEMEGKLAALGYDTETIRTDTTIEREWYASYGENE